MAAAEGQAWRRALTRTGPQALLAALAYLAIALVWSYPLVFEASTHVALPHATPKPVVMAKDQLFAVSAAGRNAAALLEGDPARLIHQRLCWPMPRSATLGEHAIELGILALPGWALSRDPLVAYNSACLLLVMIAALGAFALVRHWTGSGAAAFLSGLVFGFHPGLIGNLAHPFVIGVHWLPWVLLAFERLLEDGRPRHALALAATATLQAWVGSYPLLVLVAFALPYGLVRLAQQRASLDTRRLLLLAAAGAWVALATFAVLRFYLETADAWGVLVRRKVLLVPFASLLPGHDHAIGAVALILAATACLLPPRLRGPVPALLAGGAACWLLAGGFGQGEELTGLVPWLADRVPLLGSARVPGEVRAGVYLAAALLAGLGLHRALLRLGGRRALALAVLAPVLVLVEVFQPAVSALAFGYTRQLVLLPRAPEPEVLAAYAAFDAAGLEGPVLDVPVGVQSLRTLSEYSLSSAYHQRETAACFSSHVPPSFLAVERMAARLPSHRGIEELAAAGLRNLVVHRDVSDDAAALAVDLASHPGVTVLETTPRATALRLPAPGAVHSDPSRLELRGATLAGERFARADRTVLHVRVRNADDATWVQPRPPVPELARVRWWPPGDAPPGPWHEARLLLPLALAGGEEDTLWLELGDPPADCPSCRPEVEVPRLGWHIAPEDVREG